MGATRQLHSRGGLFYWRICRGSNAPFDAFGAIVSHSKLRSVSFVIVVLLHLRLQYSFTQPPSASLYPALPALSSGPKGDNKMPLRRRRERRLRALQGDNPLTASRSWH